MHMKKTSVAAVAACLALAAGATEFTVTCDHTNALYRLGETATFTVVAKEKDGSAPKGKAQVQLDNFGDRVLFKRTVDLAQEPKFTISGQMDRPGFLTARIFAGKSKKVFGVAYEPENLRPYRECPADFDSFWAEAIRKYDAEVTAPIKMTKVDPPSKVAACDLYELEIPAVGGRTVWGYLSVPKDTSRGPFPLVVRVPGAGPASFYDGGSANTLDLFVNVHYYKPKRGLKHKCPEHLALQKVEDEAYAKKYPVKVVRYTQCGIAVSREDYFYYGIILAANRAIDWACARPDVDKARVKYSGGSQGGGFGLILTGLNKHIRKAAVFVPAITDHLCFKIDDREAGWPRLIDAQLPENREAAERNAPYFDAVYFAQRINVPIRINVGFADTVCPPHAGYTAFNVCPSKDKAIRCGIGQDHTPLKEIRQEFSKWFEQD